jgi:predicted peptidase
MGHYKKQSECGSYNYLLYLPEGYHGAVADRPPAGWPLLLFLHGADRKGVDLDTLRASGIPRLCESRLCASEKQSSSSSSTSSPLSSSSSSCMVDVEETESWMNDADSPRTATAGLHLRRATALAQRSPHRRTPSADRGLGSSPLEQMQSFPFVVVSPLCPPFKYWRVESLASLVEEVAEQYQVDARRVYAVGEGMGGWAACALAARVPRCLAACVPIGAAADPHFVDVDRLKDTPLWLFHGSSRCDDVDGLDMAASAAAADEEEAADVDDGCDDDAEGLRASVCLVQALRRQGARSVLFTAYPTVATKKDNADSLPGVFFSVASGGGSDEQADQNELVKRSYTYDNPLLYQWLLQHSLPLLDV